VSTPTAWSERPALLAPPRTPPAGADVVVVGGGLAGCAVAALLAEEGVDVALIERRADLGLGGSARTAGLCLPGLADAPSRLVEALGEDVGRALFEATVENLDLLEAHGLMERCGALFCAASPLEEEELAASLALLEAWDHPVDAWTAAEVEERAGLRGWGSGRFDPRGGRTQPRAAIGALAQRAAEAGAALCPGLEVIAASDEGDHRVLHLVDLADPGAPLRRLRASLVVWAGDHRLGLVEPFFLDKLHPVRLQQQLRRAAPGLVAPRWPVTAQFSYAWAGPDGAGGLLSGGCRWATPHLEVMESDEEISVPVVDQKIQAVVAARFGAWGARPPDLRWSTIATFTCDGLPIVGPLPGRPTEQALCGWNGRPWSWAMLAATDVAERLLRGGPSRLPRQLHPSRFL
jgi:glycine/D-amino acid oxidase-like deaminating enzyme